MGEVRVYLKSGEIFQGRLNKNSNDACILLDNVLDEKNPAAPGGSIVFAGTEVARIQMVMGTMALPTVTEAELSTILELENPAPGSSADVTCLTRGLSWAPSYKIDLREDGKAIFDAKVTIVNTVADWENVEVELITGYPHLPYKDKADPMALDSLLPTIDSGNGYFASRSRGHSDQATMVADGFFGGGGSTLSDNRGKTDGEQTEDLFFYPLGKLSLARNGVLTVPLFTRTVAYTPVYTWEVPDPAQEAENYRNGREVEDKQTLPPVWHCVRFKNELGLPLTKAPAELLVAGRIAGQSTVDYTPEGAECTIKVNRAANVVTERSFRLLKREPHKNLRGNSTYKNLNEIGLTLCNSTPKTITVEIKQTLRGEVETASDGATSSSRMNTRDIDNPVSLVSWTVTLSPGEKKTVTATYVYMGDRW